jgi:NTE family protein
MIVEPLILIDGSSFNNVTFNLGARVTRFDVGSFRSEWRNDIMLFSEYGLRSEYYHPFTPLSHWFIAPPELLDSNPFCLYDDNQLVSSYRRRTGGGGLDVGYQFGSIGELRVGYQGGWEKFSRQIGIPDGLHDFSGAFAAARMQYKLDRLDDPVIPRAGRSLQADFLWSNASPAAPNQYPVLEVVSQNYYRITNLLPSF